MLNANIIAYRAATAAIPSSAPDHVMDAATAHQDAALDDVRNAPCLSEVDVLAKLAIAGELLADESGGHHRAARLLETIAIDLYELRSAA